MIRRSRFAATARARLSLSSWAATIALSIAGLALASPSVAAPAKKKGKQPATTKSAPAAPPKAAQEKAAQEKAAQEKAAQEKAAQEKAAQESAPPPTPAPTTSAAAAPEGPPMPMRTLVRELRSKGAPPELVDAVGGIITVILAENEELDVLSGADLKELLAVEAEKQMVGCKDDGSCLAEIADALGAELVVYGEIAMLGSQINLTLRMIESKQARAVGSVLVQAGSPEVLSKSLRGEIGKLVERPIKAHRARVAAFAAASSGTTTTTARASLPPAAEAPAAPVGPSAGPWIVAGTGAGLAVAGGAAAGLALLPGAMIAQAESAFAADPKRALDDAAYWQGWYDVTVPALLIGGGAAAVAGLAAIVGGASWGLVGPGASE